MIAKIKAICPNNNLEGNFGPNQNAASSIPVERNQAPSPNIVAQNWNQTIYNGVVNQSPHTIPKQNAANDFNDFPFSIKFNQNDFRSQTTNEENRPLQNLSTPVGQQTISKQIVQEKQYSLIVDTLLEKINVYLIGFKPDMKKYFELLKENFKFINEIETDYSDLKEKLNNQKLINNPCLAITISPEYTCRINPEWELITKLIMEQTGFLKYLKFISKKLNSRWKQHNYQID